MKTFGLIGYPLSHSFSKTYFTKKFNEEKIKNCEYLNFELKNISEFPLFISSNKNLAGLNITIPYKQSIIPYIDKLDSVAEKIGAVNTIKFLNNKTIGFNTDAYGFQFSLKPFLESHHQRALIIGNGGSSMAVQYILNEIGISYTIAVRTPSNKKQILINEINENILKHHLLVINTTPVGMHPNIYDCVNIPYQYLTSKHLLFDLIYNPEKTLFLKKGEEQGSQIVKGMSMLHLQAEKSWMIWNN